MAEPADIIDIHRQARVIRQCLEYLCYEALRANMPLTARLIGVASESALEFLSGRIEPSIATAKEDTFTRANHAGDCDEEE